MGKYTYLLMLFGYGVLLDIIGLVVWLRDRRRADNAASGGQR